MPRVRRIWGEAVRNADERLSLVDSQRRGPVLLRAVMAAADETEARELIEDWWTSIDAWGDLLPDLLTEMHRVCDRTNQILGQPLPKTHTDRFEVYRATGGDRPDGGSWTLSLDVAKRFAELIRSPRAMFLGYYAESPVIWKAVVQRSDVLAHFTSRDEAEVVLDNFTEFAVPPHSVLRLTSEEES